MTLRSAATPNPTDPAATTRAYAAYVEAVVQRGDAQLNFTVETISEMSTSALGLARRRFLANAPSAMSASTSRQPARPRHRA